MKDEFSKFLLEIGAIKFGDFKLKSGRNSPYFIDIGTIRDGKNLAKLGEFYAKAIMELNIEFDVIFGPSYKGIPIAISTAIALDKLFGISKRVAFNRKEAKDYGEGGIIIGEIKSGDRVVILDDVMTTGRTKEEIIHLLYSMENVKVAFILIAVDRMERGEGELMATKEFEVKYGIPVKSIVNIKEVAEFALRNKLIKEIEMKKILNYLEKYGGRSL
ncbi:MAG: orotate phosphoribosyltransferase [Candidatus Methanomethyliaceae archaeon]|nr:orotate phosphoribosyltransferase [Candidatus Methanomethyliaceae archaeon]MDW7970507.1 orotate phosphoribosyltransferase [Nitrososphaerota archaeon]